MKTSLIYAVYENDACVFVGRWGGPKGSLDGFARRRFGEDVSVDVLEEPVAPAEMPERLAHWIAEKEPSNRQRSAHTPLETCVYFLGHAAHPEVGYIGRTAEPLLRRLTKHRAERTGKVAEFFAGVGWERAYIKELWRGPVGEAEERELELRREHEGRCRLLHSHNPITDRAIANLTKNERDRAAYQKKRMDPEWRRKKSLQVSKSRSLKRTKQGGADAKRA